MLVRQELEDPLVLIHEKKISSINAVVKVLELALKVRINYWVSLVLTMKLLMVTDTCLTSETKTPIDCCGGCRE